jgi:hypothetical protein
MLEDEIYFTRLWIHSRRPIALEIQAPLFKVASWGLVRVYTANDATATTITTWFKLCRHLG